MDFIYMFLPEQVAQVGLFDDEKDRFVCVWECVCPVDRNGNKWFNQTEPQRNTSPLWVVQEWSIIAILTAFFYSFNSALFEVGCGQ